VKLKIQSGKRRVGYSKVFLKKTTVDSVVVPVIEK